MKNLEGIRLTEVKEKELEKKSIVVNDDCNFDDCALTEENSVSEDYNFEDCTLTEKERLEKLKNDLVHLNDDYEDCRKTGR